MVTWSPMAYPYGPSRPFGFPPNNRGPQVAALGMGTRITPGSGLVQVNTDLIEALATQGQRILPELHQLLNTSNQRLQVVEGLYLAQRLAEKKVPGVNQLYASTTRLHLTTDPLIQVYLAGFYRHIDEPAAYGPMMEMMLRHSQRPAWERQREIQLTGINAVEEIGGTLLAYTSRHANRNASLLA